MICNACNLGWSYFPCQAGSGALIAAYSFGTPVSSLAGNVVAGMRAYDGGPCFIATELYGNNSVQVDLLRRYRDQFLLKWRVGRGFVAGYYRLGPRVVRSMRKSALLRSILQRLVATAIFMVRRTRA
jgi:hypothetical protein